MDMFLIVSDINVQMSVVVQHFF